MQWGEDAVDLHYPTEAGRFPVVLFLQGGRVDKEQYSIFGESVASHGFVVAIPNHHHVIDFPGFQSEGWFSEQSQITDVMAFARCLDEGDGPLADRIDTDALYLSGHSYGAAVAISALQNECTFPFCPEDGPYTRPPELRAVAGLGINTKPRVGGTEIAATDNVEMPFAIINGASDGNALAQDTVVSYQRIEHPPKARMFIEGGNHYVMCDENNPEGPGADANEPTLAQEEGARLVGRLTALWFLATGEGHDGALQALEREAQTRDIEMEM